VLESESMDASRQGLSKSIWVCWLNPDIWGDRFVKVICCCAVAVILLDGVLFGLSLKKSDLFHASELISEYYFHVH
jgi:hypothetical protein